MVWPILYLLPLSQHVLEMSLYGVLCSRYLEPRILLAGGVSQLSGKSRTLVTSGLQGSELINAAPQNAMVTS